METIHLDTLSSISPTCMKSTNTRKLLLVPLYALFVIRSPLIGGKKQNTHILLHGTEFEEGKQGEKIQSDTIEVSNNFIS